jgi:hypothetical protein
MKSAQDFFGPALMDHQEAKVVAPAFITRAAVRHDGRLKPYSEKARERAWVMRIGNATPA